MLEKKGERAKTFLGKNNGEILILPNIRMYYKAA